MGLWAPGYYPAQRHVAPEQGEDLELHRDAVHREQRRFAGGLGPMNYEVIGVGDEGAPVEPEGGQIHTSAGRSLRLLYDRGAQFLAKPVASEDPEACINGGQYEQDESRAGDQ